MQLSEAKKVSNTFPAVIAYITDNDLMPELEVHMKKSIWGIGSRTTIYNAMNVTSWEDSTPAEKIILFEAYQMMKEAVETSTIEV